MAGVGFVLEYIKLPSSGLSTSWTDFYINVTNAQVSKTRQVKKQIKQKIKGKVTGLEFIMNAQDAWWFANVITDEYDKVVKNGKTLIGGVPVQSGNKKLMALILTRALISTQKNPTGDLLSQMGNAVIAYWTGAKLSKFPPPKMPCVGAVQNVNTITALSLFPGIWTPVRMGPQGSNGPFLLSFCLSAAIHILTVGGLFTCNCTYPPPAPPAPGMLPWVGYFVKPFSGKTLSAFNFKKLLLIAGGGVATIVALKAISSLLTSKSSKKGKKGTTTGKPLSETPKGQRQIDTVLPPGTPKVYRDALKAIMDEDEEALAVAATALGKIGEYNFNRAQTDEPAGTLTNAPTTSDNVNNTIGPKSNIDFTNNSITAKVGASIPLIGSVNPSILLKKSTENQQTGSGE